MSSPIRFFMHAAAGSLALFLACSGGGGGGGGGSVAAPTAPVITHQPGDVEVKRNAMASFTATASGNPSPTLTWQRSNDSGATWTNVDPSTYSTASLSSSKESNGDAASTFSFSVRAADNGAWFRVAASNSASTVPSDRATLTVTPSLFACGGLVLTNGATAPGYWQDGTWSPLTSPVSSEVNGMAVVGDSVFLAGQSLKGVGTALAWTVKGGAVNLSSLPSLAPTQEAGADAVAVGADGLARFGGFTTDGAGNSQGGTWTTQGWTALPLPPGASGCKIEALLPVGPVLYAAGPGLAGGQATLPGYWKDSVWFPLPNPNPGGIAGVHCLAASGGDLYVGGSAGPAGTPLRPGYWLNGVWTALPVPPGAVGDCEVKSMAVSSQGVVAGGFYLDAVGNGQPCLWSGGTVTVLAMQPGFGAGRVTSSSLI